MACNNGPSIKPHTSRQQIFNVLYKLPLERIRKELKFKILGSTVPYIHVFLFKIEKLSVTQTEKHFIYLHDILKTNDIYFQPDQNSLTRKKLRIT